MYSFLYLVSLCIWLVTLFCVEHSQQQLESDLRNLLDSIPSSHVKQTSRSWSDRMERVEQSWENCRPELYEVIMSNMALPSGVVSSRQY